MQQAQPLPWEIDSDLNYRLVRSGVFKQQKEKLSKNKRAILDIESSQLLESGVALAKYLIALKDMLAVSYTFLICRYSEKRQ